MANNITQWKPQVTIQLEYTSKILVIKTYAEVKRRMKEFLNESVTSKVTVSRSRRGEWGEWFEHWEFNAEKKPIIKKQGWM